MKRTSKIAQKVFLSTGITLVVITAVFIYLAQESGSELFRQQVHAKAQGISQFGVTLLNHLMLEGQQGHVNELLQAGVHQRHGITLLVLRSDGSVAFSSNLNEHEDVPLQLFKSDPQWGKARFFSCEERDTTYEYIITPIAKQQGCSRCHQRDEELRGYFGVKISMTELAATAKVHRVTNIAMTVVFLLGVGTAIYVTLFLFVSTPLARLRVQIARASNQMRLVEGGKSIHPLPLELAPSNDEIGDVITCFNDLVAKLDAAYGNLRRLHAAELQHADRLSSFGVMAATVAHETRNPIAGVLGALQVFHGDINDNDPKKPIFHEMILQLERMNGSLNDLLSYAKSADPFFQEMNVNDTIDQTLVLALSQADAQMFQIDKCYDPDLPCIVGDQQLLKQLLWNLVQNALQEMTSGGKLTIRTELANGLSQGEALKSIKILIGDTGKGIPASDLGRVFEPFYTTKHKGTGLGLTISKQIVEQHGGSISITSKQDQGTWVTILLPIRQSDEIIYEG